jgi:tetratricopeptide (TPR) repeat protein
VDVFEGLTSLVDKNLIQISEPADVEARFSMLETIREYAIDRLLGSTEQQAVRRAHAAYFLVLAEEGNPELNTADRVRWLTRCDAEIDNFRAALDFLFESQEVEWSLRLNVALFRFWHMREHLAEGRARLEAVLHLAGDRYARERARVTQFLGALITSQGDFAAAEGYLQRALFLYEDLGDEWGIAASLNALAVNQRDRGDYAAAQTNFERSLACWRMLPDKLAIARCLHNLANVVRVRGDYPRARWALQEAAEIFENVGDRSGAAWSINQLGDIVREQEDLTKARECYQRALSIFRDAGDRWGSTRSLADLGYIDCKRGEFAAAHGEYREALEISATLGHKRGIARVLEGSACLALAQKQTERALRLAGAAARLRDLMGAPLIPSEKSELEQELQPAWQSLPAAQAAHAWREGSEMSLERAVQYCLEKINPEITTAQQD